MREETADSVPFMLQEEPSCCDSVMFCARGRVVKGLSGSVAGSVLFHALLAATVVLLPFMLPKRNIRRQFFTVSLVDSAQLGGSAGALEAVYEGPSGRHHARPSPAVPEVKDIKAKVAGATARQHIVPKIDLPDWPKDKSTKPGRTAAGPAPKVPASAGRHGKKHSPAHRHPAERSKAVHRLPVRRAPKAAARKALADMEGSEMAKIITTGKGTGTGVSAGAGGPAGGMPPQPDFHRVAHRAPLVDKPPEPVRKCEPVYPYRARALGISGKVVVKFLVNKAGRVSRAVILQAHPKGVFDRSALDAILKWRFKPARSRGKPVDTWVILPFRFQLTQRGILNAFNG